MVIDALFGVCVVLCFALIISFTIYSIFTQKIILDQKSEISKLKKALVNEQKREKIEIITNGRNPEFGGF